MLAFIEAVNKVVPTTTSATPSMAMRKTYVSAQRHDSDGQYFPMVMAKANNG